MNSVGLDLSDVPPARHPGIRGHAKLNLSVSPDGDQPVEAGTGQPEGSGAGGLARARHPVSSLVNDRSQAGPALAKAIPLEILDRRARRREAAVDLRCVQREA